MPIKRIFWSGDSARDIHVLRGNSARNLTLRDLAFERTDGTLVFASDYITPPAPTPPPGDVTLLFRPLFRATESATEFTGHGIHVNKTTGLVTVDAAAPARPKRNFIIEVTATNVAGSSFTETIRVHVHGSVVRAWLTPDQLTIRPTETPRTSNEQSNYRFAVRAEFDDGVVGDVTTGHDVLLLPAARFNDGGRFIILQADANNTNVPVSATLPPTLGNVATPAANARIGEPWAFSAASPKVTIVVGGGWPGTVNPAFVPNVLFLGDGFTDTPADRNAFEQITNALVQHLKKDKLVRPFDLLATSMNFWRAFQPSGTRGISIRNEVFRYSVGSDVFARVIPSATKPPATGDWTLDHMIYTVGLPVPADDRDAAALRADWTALLDPDPGARITDDLIAQWKLLSNRTFVDELDTFPALSIGNPPAANNTNHLELDLHEDRGGTAELLRFYPILADERGVTPAAATRMGEVWARNVFRFDNTDLVVLISAARGGRAQNAAGYMTLSLESAADIPVAMVPGRNALRVNIVSVPADVAKDTCRTLAHELAHSFALEDEYVDFDGNFPRTEADLTAANVQTDADVRRAGDIHGEEIKWNWHRVKNAGVVAGSATAAGGGRFAIPVDLGHGFRFTQDAPVLLREREWGERLQKNQPVLDKLMVVAEPSTASLVVVKGAPGVTLDLSDFAPFPAGSLLFVPVPEPDATHPETGPFARMVARNIREHITSTKRPLTVVPCVTDRAAVQKPNLTGVNLPFCFKNKPKVIGLYAGGVRFACGIFHPAGTCMMRNNHEDHAQFCAVCRYIVVDLIDPAKHADIDADYGKIYPLR